MTDKTPVKLERQMLYESVWNEPIAKVAAKIGVTAWKVKGYCKKLLVPLPPKGYWKRIAHGKSPKRHVLPMLPTGVPDHLILNPWFDLRKRERLSKTMVPRRIEFPTELVCPHPMIKLTARALKDRLKAAPGARVETYENEFLDISVTHSTFDRALLIMDTLIKELERLGYAVKTATDYERKTNVIIKGQQICFRLRELCTQRERELTSEEKRRLKVYPQSYISDRLELIPRGVLSFEIDSYSSPRQKWVDGEKQRVENCLDEILFCLETAATRQGQMAAEREREQKIREARQRLEQEENARRERFEKQVGLWLKAKNMRAFIAAMQQRALRIHGEIQQGSEAECWIKWATAYANEFDPLIKMLPESTQEPSNV